MKYTLVPVILILYCIHVWGQTTYVENAQTYIPDSLIECYKNHSLRNPENRLPMTIETFIDLVRKVENFQKGTEDVTSLTTSMLHMFRLDGIQLHSDVMETEGVIPYAVSGKAFFKHRVVLKYLIPSNKMQFPNESLSQVELCTLHFMLSHTIEKSQRGDESTVCGKLQNYESPRSSRVPRSLRYKRQVQEDNEDEDTKVTSKDQTVPPVNPTDKTQEKTNDTLLWEESAEQENDTEVTTSHLTSLTSEQHNLTDALDAEHFLTNTTVSEEKSGKIIFDDDMPGDIHTNSEVKSRRIMSGNLMTASTSTPSIQPRAPGQPRWPSQPGGTRVYNAGAESSCPVEYGVVKTKWGSVSLGTVLAGIAAGAYAQQIPVQKLILTGPRAMALSNVVATSLIDNKFAATLTGDLSEVALQQGPKGDIKIGTPGGWNSTIYPKWYFDKVKTNTEMTDAEIRGGLDGLIMGTKIQEWTRLTSSSRGILKLSQLLDMYYSEDGVFDEKYRACDRRNLFPEVAGTQVMQEQTFRFAVVLDQQTLTSASLEESVIQKFSTDSVEKLKMYIPQMVDELCTKTTTSSTAAKSPDLTKITPYVNLTVVIDSRWRYTDIRNILFNLMQKLNVGEFGSKVTVLDGNKRAPFLVNAIYTTDIETNFTENSYSSHEVGMDIPKALEQELKFSMQGILADEDTNNIAGGRSTIVLFIPSEAVNLNQNDLTIAKEQIRYFTENLPDVKFLYLAPGSKENYKELVEDITKDVITYSHIGSETDIPPLVDQVVQRIKKVPIRISNPNCGADWSADSYNLAEFTHSVKQYGVNYHQLQANYFFGVGSAEIKIDGITNGPLKVCFSRKNEFPGANSTGDTDTQCQQISGTSYTYKLSDPCEGCEYLSQCPPLYISVASIGKVQSLNCNDCQYPNNVKYKISHLGMSCKSGVGAFAGNSFFILTALSIAIVLKNRVVGG